MLLAQRDLKILFETLILQVAPPNLNRRFSSYSKPLFQSEAKMIFIIVQLNLIFTRKDLHLASFWK